MPFKVVEEFEQAIAKYAGAPYAVAVDSCTNALFLCLKYCNIDNKTITIPSKTYISVPCSIIHAGGKVKFKNIKWKGCYQLAPLPVYDSAKRFKKNMYIKDTLYCLSFHAKKHIPIGKGGMILTDDKYAYEWLKLARYNGRSPVDLKKDTFKMVGWNFYMSPNDAARGLWLFNSIKENNNKDLLEDYPDLSRYKFEKSGAPLKYES